MQLPSGTDPATRAAVEDLDARLRRLEQANQDLRKGRVTNMSKGVKSTDAVTVGQLNDAINKLRTEILTQIDEVRRRT